MGWRAKAVQRTREDLKRSAPLVWREQKRGEPPGRWLLKISGYPAVELACGPDSPAYKEEYERTLERAVQDAPESRFSAERQRLTRLEAELEASRQPPVRPTWLRDMIVFGLSDREAMPMHWHNPGVYFAQAFEVEPQLIKIGYADCPPYRIHDWGCGCPSRVRLIGVLPGNRITESEMHQRFAEFRVLREWFEPAQEILDFARQHG